MNDEENNTTIDATIAQQNERAQEYLKEALLIAKGKGIRALGLVVVREDADSMARLLVCGPREAALSALAEMKILEHVMTEALSKADRTLVTTTIEEAIAPDNVVN